MLSISGTKARVGTGGCTKIGLTKEEIKNTRESFKKETGKKNVSDKAYLIKGRAPVLMLHVIQAEYIGSVTQELPPYLFALGVGFPKTDKGTETANYKVNRVEWNNWVDLPNEPNDEEE